MQRKILFFILFSLLLLFSTVNISAEGAVIKHYFIDSDYYIIYPQLEGVTSEIAESKINNHLFQQALTFKERGVYEGDYRIAFWGQDFFSILFSGTKKVATGDKLILDAQVFALSDGSLLNIDDFFIDNYRQDPQFIELITKRAYLSSPVDLPPETGGYIFRHQRSGMLGIELFYPAPEEHIDYRYIQLFLHDLQPFLQNKLLQSADLSFSMPRHH